MSSSASIASAASAEADRRPLRACHDDRTPEPAALPSGGGAREASFRRLAAPLAGYAVALGGPAVDAERIVSDAFLATWSVPRDDPTTDAPRAALYRAVRDAALVEHRRTAIAAPTSVAHGAAHEVWLLIRSHGLTSAEVALTLGITSVSVETRMGHALLALRDGGPGVPGAEARLWELLARHLCDTCTPGERDALRRWAAADDGVTAALREAERIWQVGGTHTATGEWDIDAWWRRLEPLTNGRAGRARLVDEPDRHGRLGRAVRAWWARCAGHPRRPRAER